MEEINNNCKMCPKCKVPIYRQSGCPHMFCVMCKTGFNWNTGIIIKKVNNPHFFEYINKITTSDKDYLNDRKILDLLGNMPVSKDNI